MLNRSRQLDRLQRIIATQTAIVQSDLDLACFMQMIVDTVQELTDAKGAVIELVEDEWMVYRCGSGLVASHVGLRLNRKGSLSGTCVEAGRALRCDDTDVDDRVDKEACRRVGVRSMICSPLFQNGVAIGVLKVMSDHSKAFDAEDEQTLNLLAGILGAALGKQLAFDNLQQAELRLRVLLENATDAVISLDDAGCVLRWNAAAERMFCLPVAEALGASMANLIAGPCPWLACIFLDTQDGPQSGLCELPGKSRGEMPVSVEFTLTHNRFGASSELTAFIHDVTEHKRLEQSIREIALTDGLTGVANRRKIFDVLDHALERGKRGFASMGLLFMDLNGFKEINDIHGHDMGDRVLQEVAERLLACTRAADVIGRLGGDEFIVLAEGLQSESEAQKFADKIVTALEMPFPETSIAVGASIGISMYKGQLDANQWLCEADKAMYQAKHRVKAGRQIAVYAEGEVSSACEHKASHLVP